MNQNNKAKNLLSEYFIIIIFAALVLVLTFSNLM